MKERIPFSSDFFFRQLFDDVSGTYTYLLGDVESKDAILIDPGWTLILKNRDGSLNHRAIAFSVGEGSTGRDLDQGARF